MGSATVDRFLGVESSSPLKPAVVVEGLHKEFRIPHERVSTLKEQVLHPLRRATHERFQALQEISFTVEEGEFFGIVGRNGSGKSTLLKCLAGIYQVDGGQAYINGRLSTFIELGVGFNHDLAAHENILINGVMLGLSPREARSRADEMIAFAGLEEFVDLKIKNYSSGMLVRLGFAVMVHVDAEVLLIDEVLAVGDAAFQQKCYDEFNRIRDERRTVLFVTHDMAAVERYCDRAMLIEHGRIVALGDPHEVGQRYIEVNFAPEARGVGRAPEVPAPEVPEDEESEPTAELEQPAPAADRFGDQRAEILEAWFEDADGEPAAALPSGAPCAFAAQIRFNDDVEDPLFGVVLQNSRKQSILAFNTLGDGARSGWFSAGEELTFRVRFDNVLAPDRYHATPAIARGGTGIAWIDRRESFVSVVVTGIHRSDAAVEIPCEVELARDSAASPSGTSA